MVDSRRSSIVEKRIATRGFSRFYPWILFGLFLLFFATFPFLKQPILISIPVVVTSWFYYRKAGVIASLLAILINVILIETFIGQMDGANIWNTSPGLVIGSLFLIGVSFGIGYLREVIESLHQRELLLQSEERFLTLLGMIMKKILEHTSWSAVTEDSSQLLFFDIIHHLTNLFIADSGYLIRLESNPTRALLIASTNSAEISPVPTELDSQNSQIAARALEKGQTLAIANLANSAYAGAYAIINPSGKAKSVLCIPLKAREYQFGAAILAYESRHNFTSEEIMHAERIGYQVALALWGLRQDQINIQQLNETLIMMKIGRALSETEQIGLDTVLQLIVDSARKLIPEAEKTVIHLLDRDNKSLIPQATAGFQKSEKTIPRLKMHVGNGAAGQVMRDGVTLNIADVNTDPRFLQAAVKPTYQSLLVAPIQQAGRQLGTISVESEKSHAFSEHEAELLEALGNQAAVAIENTRLFESTQQSLKEMNALYKISKGLSTSLDANELIKDVLTMLKQNFGYYYAQIYLIEPESGDLIFQRGSDEIGAELFEQGFRLPRGKGIAGYVAETATPFLTNNVEDSVFFYRNPLLPNTQSQLAVPIKLEGRVAGVLDIQHEPPHRLSDRDLHLMSTVADQLAVALQKANLYTNLQTALVQEQNMRSQLNQAERLSLIGKLLASVSHELNNPLQTIQNALYLARDDLQHANIHIQEMDIIAAEIDRMSMLLERLRSTYRPLQPEEFRPVQVNNIIEDTYQLISTYLRHKNISFEFHPDPDVPPVRGLADHLRQVMLNLFINAVEAMPEGGHLCVDTFILPGISEVAFSITDSGVGIEPEMLPRIFEPFVTNKRTGTGLGLTITHEIVEQHQGRILAENVPAGGAKFTIWLPAWKETAQ